MTQTELFADDSALDLLRPVTPEAARAIIKQNPKIKASVTEGEDFPLYNSEANRVRLFLTIKDAQNYLRRRHEALSELGYEKDWGTLLRGAFVFIKPHPDGPEKVGLILEKRPKEAK
jgi:hypothetical protein